MILKEIKKEAEQPNITGKQPRKFETIKFKWLLGQKPRAFQLNGTLFRMISKQDNIRKIY